MKLSKPLLYSFLAIGLLLPLNNLLAQFNDCSEIEVETSVTHTTDEKANGSIKLVFKNDYKLYNIHLLKSSDKDRLNVNSDVITNLEKGKYSIVITSKKSDSQLCPKFLELIVK